MIKTSYLTIGNIYQHANLSDKVTEQSSRQEKKKKSKIH